MNTILSAYVINREKVGVVEGAQNSRFVFEALQTVAVSSEPFGEYFNRDPALEPGVARAIHLSHPACAQR
jgi:hypothetical protein